MDVDHPERDQVWDQAVRSESETQRLDRNWTSLLQELRVTQTGVQLLTGFLLIAPFEPQFSQLSATMRVVYLATVVCSISSTVLLVAPVAMDRLLFAGTGWNLSSRPHTDSPTAACCCWAPPWSA